MEHSGEFMVSIILKNKLETYRKKTRVSWELIEQDYALSWMLFGITKMEKLSKHFVFKGGTCLKNVILVTIDFHKI